MWYFIPIICVTTESKVKTSLNIYPLPWVLNLAARFMAFSVNMVPQWLLRMTLWTLFIVDALVTAVLITLVYRTRHRAAHTRYESWQRENPLLKHWPSTDSYVTILIVYMVNTGLLTTYGPIRRLIVLFKRPDRMTTRLLAMACVISVSVTYLILNVQIWGIYP